MNIKAVAWILGSVLLVLAAFLLVPAAVGASYGEVRDALACLWSAAAAAACGGALVFLFRGSTLKNGRLAYHRREGIAAVGLSWVACGLVGALPFLFTGAIASPVDATFESVSGFTTTGSTILSSDQIDGLSHTIALWRSFTHWLGGVGIVMVFVLVLPTGARSLFRAEVTGYDREAQSARVRDSAKHLFIVYSVLTLACGVALWALGLEPLDAAIHTFGTVATGGFSSHGSSVAHFQSWPVEAVIVAFMFLSGVSFTLYQTAYGKRFRTWIPTLWASAEFRTYVGITVGCVSVVTLALWFSGRPDREGMPDYSSFTLALRDSSFSVLTMQTCSGFATADFDRWPDLCRALLMLAAFVGGCAGSTAGGLKVIRLVILFKLVRMQVARTLHPRAVHSIRLDGQNVDASIATQVGSYFGLWCLFAAFSTLFVASFGIDIVSASTSVLATLNNAGPGLGLVGPASNFATLPMLVKLWLTVCMLAGRLEFYAILSLVLPTFWRQ
jgi:trk system potassium uptake protein TrkH